MAPRAFAEIIAGRLQNIAGVKSVDIAGPGFLNIRLDASAAGELARSIVESGAEFGRSDVNADQKVNLEFVSANPTGPIHMGGTRWAAVGEDRKSTRLNSSHVAISYAVFCLKKKKKT